MEGDNYYVAEVAKIMERLFFPATSLRQAVEAIANVERYMPFSAVMDENTRYYRYYRQVLNEIFELPHNQSSSHGRGRMFGYAPSADHPSAFIRKLSEYELSGPEECSEGFVEWVKKRELVISVVSILDAKANRES
jgi:hypothetical protein